MPQMQMLKGQHCLIVRGQGGREELADVLRKKGVTVEYWETYKRIIPNIDNSPVTSLLSQNKLDVITITSGEALENLLTMLGKEYHRQLFAIALVVVSDRIRNFATQMGFKRIAVADNPSDSAILDTVTTLINEE
jgi:uroporphyrinogen-III synthase